MLKKLLKYELKYVFKGVIVFYILGLFFAILTRIFLNIENSFIMNILGKIFSGATISMIFNIVINNLLRLWVRFKNNFYKDESYLTHTLPIKRETHYLSKFISSVIILSSSILVITLILFVAYYSKENLLLVKKVLLPLATIYESTITKILLSFVIVVFLEFFNLLQAGYTGIILGHRMENAKTGFSILYGSIVYMASQTVLLIFLFIVSLFNPSLMNLFHTIEIIDVEMIKYLVVLSIIGYGSLIAILYFINVKLFKDEINVL